MSSIHAITQRVIRGTMRRVSKPTRDNIGGVVIGVVAVGYSAYLRDWSWQTLWSNAWEAVIAPCLLTLCLLMSWHIIQSWREIYRQEGRPYRNAFGSIKKAPPRNFLWKSYISTVLCLAVPISLCYFILKKSPTIFTSPSFVVDEATNIVLPDLHSLNRVASPPSDHPPSLAELFTQDFPEDVKAQNNLKMKGIDLPLKEQVYLDFMGKSKFVGFYVPQESSRPDNESAAIICEAFAGQVQPMLNLLEKNGSINGGLGMENVRTMSELMFTRLALIYHESLLTTLEKADVIKAFKDKGLDVDFRGPDYAMTRVVVWQQNRKK